MLEFKTSSVGQTSQGISLSVFRGCCSEKRKQSLGSLGGCCAVQKIPCWCQRSAIRMGRLFGDQSEATAPSSLVRAQVCTIASLNTQHLLDQRSSQQGGSRLGTSTASQKKVASKCMFLASELKYHQWSHYLYQQNNATLNPFKCSVRAVTEALSGAPECRYVTLTRDWKGQWGNNTDAASEQFQHQTPI